MVRNSKPMQRDKRSLDTEERLLFRLITVAVVAAVLLFVFI